MRKIGEKGMVSVETMISFVGFLFVTVIIIMFVNLAAVQTRVHHALTQTAKEVSVYSYLFELTGLTGGSSDTGKSSDELSGFLDSAGDILNTLMGGKLPIGSANSKIEDALKKGKDGIAGGYNDIKNSGSDPVNFFGALMMVLLNKGLDGGLDALFGYLVAPAIFDRYMEITGVNPDAQSYFRGIGVFMDGYNPSDPKKGLTFIKLADGDTQGSHFLANGGDIVVKVEYYYDFGAFITILPKKYSKLKIVQQVKTKAWVGDGQHYHE